MLSEKVPLIRSASHSGARKNGAAYPGMQLPGVSRSAASQNHDTRALRRLPPPGTMERRLHPLAREFARLLHNYRRRKQLSVEELAKGSGIPAAAIQRFENASHAPDITELLILSAIYGVPAWKIIKHLQACAVRLEEIDNEP